MILPTLREGQAVVRGKRRGLWLLSLLIGLLFAGCAGGPPPGGDAQDAQQGTGSQYEAFLSSDKPKVAATSTILADMTRTVAGDGYSIYSILKPGADPHVYEPSPGDSRVLSRADLVLYNGFNLEPQLVKLIGATQNPAPKVPVAEAGGIKPYKLEKTAGIVAADPHAWGSAANGVRYVSAIEKSLVETFPKDKERFAANAARYRKDLEALDGWIREQIATIPEANRKLVSSHDAFQYYGRAYGLPVTGSILGVSTEEEPSARKIADLVEKIRKEQVRAVFIETSTAPELLQSLARDAGVKIGGTLYSDSVGASGTAGDTYIKMLTANTRTIVEALGGTYTAFVPPSAGK
ncbi:MAG: zinc ABC transporter substrate-binding protein [Aphanocapsa lilacina HA4352-LM1]|jgi:manganese/iron transport system substrate-binding protein|nr:zinc ABC transporter substrate-binding protein [Aphanocapsa lilacina HA4352-LM1]